MTRYDSKKTLLLDTSHDDLTGDTLVDGNDTLEIFNSINRDNFLDKVISLEEKDIDVNSIDNKEESENLTDIILNKVLNNLINERVPERESFNLEEEKKVVSVTKLVSNLQNVATRLPIVYTIQDAIVRLVTWRNPSGTIISLMILTIIFYRPAYLLLIILLFSIFTYMVNGFEYKNGSRLKQNKARVIGSSLLVDIFKSGPSNAWYPTSRIEEYDNNSGTLNLTKVETNNSELRRNSVELMLTLRDLQKMMNDFIELLTAVDNLVYNIAGFRNEKDSTLIFIGGVFFCIFLFWIIPFINLSYFFISTLWIAMISIHPNITALKEKISKKNNHSSINTTKNTKKKDLLNKHILLDEKKEINSVEIFELWKRDSIGSDWNFYLYSSSIYTNDDPYRKQLIPPKGVKHISQIKPPNGWQFGDNYGWIIKPVVDSWTKECNITLTDDMSFEGEYLVDPEFKRRKFTRKVMRTGVSWNQDDANMN